MECQKVSLVFFYGHSCTPIKTSTYKTINGLELVNTAFYVKWRSRIPSPHIKDSVFLSRNFPLCMHFLLRDQVERKLSFSVTFIILLYQVLLFCETLLWIVKMSRFFSAISCFLATLELILRINENGNAIVTALIHLVWWSQKFEFCCYICLSFIHTS